VVLSGKDGAKISRTLTDSIGSQSSPLTLSIKGKGNDIFIHWLANCKGHDKEKLAYSFLSGESMHDQMRADVCHALFGSQQEATLVALQRFNESAETVLYSSLYWDSFEHANATNTSAMAYNFFNQNPNKEPEFKTNVKDNEYSVIPKLADDFHDVFAELQKEMAYDPEGFAYNEAEERPDRVENVNEAAVNKRLNLEEVVPNMRYSQPHKIRKYPTELGPNQQDSFENPYRRNYQRQQPQYPQVPQEYQRQQPQYPQVPQEYPQYPQQQPLYPPQQGTGYGRKKRRKRDTQEAYDAHWGIHRIMSTGMNIFSHNQYITV
jgi:hypothetical protein